MAVAFWNLVGAGLFGFLINPPIALYYMQGLNLTPVHGHTALFGVYGMLGLGLTLFCLRALKPGRKWKEGPLKLSFWSLNLGLIFMVILSMLPVGLLQAWASIEHGTWYARSAEFMQSSTMQSLRWTHSRDYAQFSPATRGQAAKGSRKERPSVGLLGDAFQAGRARLSASGQVKRAVQARPGIPRRRGRSAAGCAHSRRNHPHPSMPSRPRVRTAESSPADFTRLGR